MDKNDGFISNFSVVPPSDPKPSKTRSGSFNLLNNRNIRKGAIVSSFIIAESKKKAKMQGDRVARSSVLCYSFDDEEDNEKKIKTIENNIQSEVSQALHEHSFTSTNDEDFDSELEIRKQFGKKAHYKFSLVEKLLPDQKLDHKLKLNVISALKEIQCWSEDEDEYEINEDGETVLKSSSQLQFEMPHQKVISKVLAKPKYKKEKVSMKRPKQLPQRESRKSFLAKKQLDDREQIRDDLMKKTVQIFLDIKTRQEYLNESSIKQYLNEISSYKELTLQKLVFATVHNVLHIGKLNYFKWLKKEERREKRRQEHRLKCVKIIIRYWKSFGVYKKWKSLLNLLRKQKAMEIAAAKQEEAEYRLRVARRKIKEDRKFKDWRKTQEITPTFPVKPTSKPSYREKDIFPAADPVKSVSSLSFRKQGSRPDLAPFSTMIDNMIKKESLFKPNQVDMQETWEDQASVSQEYLDLIKNNKSPAFIALEKLSGLSETDINRYKLPFPDKTHKSYTLKTIPGSSIISL